MTELSIIIPVLNESEYVERLIQSIYGLDDIRKQILFVDGGSTDGTYEKLVQIQSDFEHVEVIKNENKFVSQAFNKAFDRCRGHYIALIGAHAIYPENYFKSCLDAIESGACEVCGGRLKQIGITKMGQAIGHCMSSKFGVGNTEFRTSTKRKYVDSVAYAVYSRDVFQQVGLFDETLIRNQDDEFHYRINAAGMRILMLPELQTLYYVRETLGDLFKQYFQYGLYKPLVLKKVKSGLRIRHLVPFLFTVYLITLLFFAYWAPILVLPLMIYGVIAIGISAAREAPFKVRMRMPLVFLVLHVAYGAGFLAGITKLYNVK